jgi:HTH-type transcriptional regulator/antitoxin HigA
MKIRPIRNDEDHSAALALMERLWGAADGSPEADTLDVVSVLVDDYENTRWPIQELDPIDTIRAHMVASGRSQADLANVIGSRSRASEVIARKRALTLGMIRSLESEWSLPATLLIAPYNLRKAASTKQVAAKKSSRKGRHRRTATRRRAAA